MGELGETAIDGAVDGGLRVVVNPCLDVELHDVLKWVRFVVSGS